MRINSGLVVTAAAAVAVTAPLAITHLPAKAASTQAVHSGTAQIDTAQIDTAQVNTTQANAAQVNTTQAKATKVSGAAQIDANKAGSAQAGATARTVTSFTHTSFTPTSFTPTSFTTVSPWTSTGALRVKATVHTAGGDATCAPSDISGRRDVYRCYVGNVILDPAFKSPTANSVVVSSGNAWVEYKSIGSFTHGDGGASRIWRVQLANGATCDAATGAGPAALPKYPTWVGFCTGGPYADGQFPVWRATADDGRNANFPLLAANSAHTSWVVPVEYPAGHVSMVPVVRAYR